LFWTDFFCFHPSLDKKNWIYSQTCVHQPPSGHKNSGRYWQVVVVRRSFMLKKIKLGPKDSGRFWQVVAIRRWSLTQVWLYIIKSQNLVINLIMLCISIKTYFRCMRLKMMSFILKQYTFNKYVSISFI